MLPLVVGSQVDESFVEDVMESLASNQPVLILDPDQTAFSKWSGMLPRAIGSMDATKITNQLRTLIDADDVDSIFFLAPSQAELISQVTGALGLLKSKINVIIPYGQYEGLEMRLDSRLYLYKTHDEDKVTLYESYQIRYGLDVFCPFIWSNQLPLKKQRWTTH